MNRDQIINLAAAQVGIKESPPNSNCTKYGKWFGLDGQKWCAMFVSWVYYHTGNPLGNIDTDLGYSSCQSGFNHWSKKKEMTDDPMPGDIVLYDWDHDGHCDHTGIFLKWVDGHSLFQSYEGNTSVGNNSDGGQVMIRTRNIHAVRAFVSPAVLRSGLQDIEPSLSDHVVAK